MSPGPSRGDESAAGGGDWQAEAQEEGFILRADDGLEAGRPTTTSSNPDA
jgi:hypothetical protein